MTSMDKVKQEEDFPYYLEIFDSIKEEDSVMEAPSHTINVWTGLHYNNANNIIDENLKVKEEFVKEEFCEEEIIRNGDMTSTVLKHKSFFPNSEGNNAENSHKKGEEKQGENLQCGLEISKPVSNSVKYLQSINFSQLILSEKVKIKEKGRHTPVLSILQKSTSRSKEYTRQFCVSVYQKSEWLCGCDKKNALFCFPCLLFGGDSSWTKIGVTDLRHLPQKVMKHEQSSKHINNVIDLSMLGKVNIAAQIDSAYKISIAKHNEEVEKNRNVLSKIINCIKFCGKFELPLRGHDETSSSKNPGVFRGLVDFACSLDSSLDAHIHNAAVFKGTSKSIHNELLESMLEICKNKIKEEVKNAEYLAVMCDETMDSYDKTQMVIVLRYEL
ncbi:zinc finger MYM-type protein 1-like [Cherax quadricarinatus]|uniref:zinc finger MYM-type protein 1-like n=1 Tax=Cherax quadricarinatus TaxID=27406 RepID=UPI00387EDC06